ncbi:TPA: hypothetical protein ACH3X1_015362 [Trebouxia sp. C0004]
MQLRIALETQCLRTSADIMAYLILARNSSTSMDLYTPARRYKGAQCKHRTSCTAPECNFQRHGRFSCMVDVSMALWHTLDIIGRQFSERSVLVSEDAEECQLSQQMTQLIVPIMRKNLTLEDSVWQDAVCCELLSGCMHQVQQPVVCQAVARKLADTGGLSALAEGISQSRPQARYAIFSIRLPT